jgi:hypothetical protein
VAAAASRAAVELVEVVEVVDDDVADAGVEGLGQLALGLGVAVQVDLLGIHPGPQRQRELSPAGDVAAVALLGEEPQDRRCTGRPSSRRRAGRRRAGRRRRP